MEQGSQQYQIRFGSSEHAQINSDHYSSEKIQQLMNKFIEKKKKLKQAQGQIKRLKNEIKIANIQNINLKDSCKTKTEEQFKSQSGSSDSSQFNKNSAEQIKEILRQQTNQLTKVINSKFLNFQNLTEQIIAQKNQQKSQSEILKGQRLKEIIQENDKLKKQNIEKIDEYQKRLTQMINKNDKLEKQKQKLKMEQQRLKTQNKKLEQLQNKLKSKQNDLKLLADSRKNYQNQLNKFDAKIKQKERQCQNWISKNSDLKANVERLQKQNNQMKKNQSKSKSKSMMQSEINIFENNIKAQKKTIQMFVGKLEQFKNFVNQIVDKNQLTTTTMTLLQKSQKNILIKLNQKLMGFNNTIKLNQQQKIKIEKLIQKSKIKFNEEILQNKIEKILKKLLNYENSIQIHNQALKKVFEKLKSKKVQKIENQVLNKLVQSSLINQNDNLTQTINQTVSEFYFLYSQTVEESKAENKQLIKNFIQILSMINLLPQKKIGIETVTFPSKLQKNQEFKNQTKQIKEKIQNTNATIQRYHYRSMTETQKSTQTQAQLKKTKEQFEKIKKELTQLKEKYQNGKIEIKILENDKEKLNASLLKIKQESENKINSLQKDSFQKETKLKQQLNKIQTQKNRYKAQLDKTNGDLTNSKIKIQKIQNVVQTNQEIIAELRDKLTKSNYQIKQLNKMNDKMIDEYLMHTMTLKRLLQILSTNIVEITRQRRKYQISTNQNI